MTSPFPLPTPDTLQIRPAQPDDLPALQALLAASGLEAHGVETSLDQFLVAVADGVLAGAAGHERYGDRALLRSVAVAPAARRSGIGGRLVRRQLSLLSAAGVGSVYLLTTTAPRWFEHQGFTPLARDQLPPEIAASEQASRLCPASAQAMARQLPRLQIRESNVYDQEAIRTIYNQAVETSVASFDLDPRSKIDHYQWFADRLSSKLPIWVAATDDQQIAGWATLGGFRPRPGYRFTGEHSVYVDSRFRGTGVGHQLLATVLNEARERGLHTLLAVIGVPNPASVALHQAHGFVPVGCLREVGHKFDRWVDISLLQWWAEPPGQPAPTISPDRP